MNDLLEFLRLLSPETILAIAIDLYKSTDNGTKINPTTRLYKECMTLVYYDKTRLMLDDKLALISETPL
jgi:hypothetical protein